MFYFLTEFNEFNREGEGMETILWAITARDIAEKYSFISTS